MYFSYHFLIAESPAVILCTFLKLKSILLLISIQIEVPVKFFKIKPISVELAGQAGGRRLAYSDLLQDPTGRFEAGSGTRRRRAGWLPLRVTAIDPDRPTAGRVARVNIAPSVADEKT
jgi:hypothetical protein